MSLLGLFERDTAVEIGPENGPGVRIGDLRVGFRVEHKADRSPSKASIRIYNPSQVTIDLLRAPFTTIRLLAGYSPAPRVIFQGPPVKGGIDLRVEGPDRVLKVDATDGGRAFVETFIQVSFTTPTTFGQVLALVLAQTQWARGAVTVLETTPLPHGIVLIGRPAEVLDRLAATVPPAGADWFVRDNALYVVPRGTATPEVGPLLSSLQGNLIGSPTTTKKGVKVRGLIDATMRPGRTFVVQSQVVNGPYVAKDVVFEGDSGYDTPYYMTLEGRPVGVP